MRPRVLHATWFSPDVGALGLRANIRPIGRAMWAGQLRTIEWGRAICHGLRGRQRVMAQAQVLAGRVAIVTGAANGMGRVMARALAGAGAKVAGVDVDAGGLDRLAAEPVSAGKFLNAVADVSKAADCRHAVEQVLGTFGALDILINCAGISMSTAARHKEARIKFFEADPEGWRRIVAINAIGAFLMARFAAEPMIKRGWGRIINVTTSFDTMLAGGLARLAAIRRHQRLPLHRPRLGRAPAGGRGCGAGARAGGMARAREERRRSPRLWDVARASSSAPPTHAAPHRARAPRTGSARHRGSI